MSKIFIHIGLHKTGSTTLQHFLYTRKDALASLGVAYSAHGLNNFAHHNLVYNLRNEKRFRPEVGGWHEFVRSLADTAAPSIVISSEDFEFLEPERVRQIAADLEERDVTLIVYLRSQEELIQSDYTQRIKHGFETRPWKAYFPRAIEEKRFNFYHHLSKWSENFKAARLVVRVLQKDQLVGGDVVTDFLNIIGMQPEMAEGALSVSEYLRTTRLNESPGPKTVEVLRVLAQLQVDGAGWSREDFSALISVPLLKHARDNGWDQKKASFISGAEIDVVRTRFKESNAEVAREYLQKDSELFGKSKAPAATIFDAANMTAMDLLAVQTIVATAIEQRRLRLNR